MDLNGINGFTLLGLSQKNVILGKNGCGKSYLLKQLEQGLQQREGFGKVRYISPERGGVLQYEPNIEQNIAQDPRWIENSRRQNQSGNFRQQSATLFRRLELLVLREIERDHTRADYVARNFDDTIQKLNILLDRVRLERDLNRAFMIVNRETGEPTTPGEISSGESELISLGIEFLVFMKECETGTTNVFLVDEPDVHLHPDLQDRLARFIIDALRDKPVTLILATHSTALVAALAEGGDARVAFMRRNDASLRFKSITDVDRAILPIFGAHPLSNVFNKAPIFLIEGEDDERLWQHVVRSSEGRLRVFPRAVDGIDRFTQFETEVNNIIESVYDDAKGYSLRDRDLHPELINDVGHVIRMRLSCRAAENLMLSDEALALAGTDWVTLQENVRQWADANAGHKYYADVRAFTEGGFDRKGHDLKTIRNILIGLITNKPWEFLVGQAIAALAVSGGKIAEGSLRGYLGTKVCQEILKLD